MVSECFAEIVFSELQYQSFFAFTSNCFKQNRENKQPPPGVSSAQPPPMPPLKSQGSGTGKDKFETRSTGVPSEAVAERSNDSGFTENLPHPPLPSEALPKLPASPAQKASGEEKFLKKKEFAANTLTVMDQLSSKKYEKLEGNFAKFRDAMLELRYQACKPSFIVPEEISKYATVFESVLIQKYPG